MHNKHLTLPTYATAAEIGEFLHLSRSTVHTLSKQGKFPAPIKLGRVLRWNTQSVLDWIEQQQGANQ